MGINILQILVLSAFGALAVLDSLTFDIGLNKPIGIGLLTGIVVGDVPTGLFIGGTLQLLILGVGTYGGASIPDYMSATIIATALVTTSDGTLTPEAAITIAVPVGLLMLNFDILARYSNTFIAQLIEKDIENEKYESAVRKNYLGIITWSLSRFVPIFVALVLGNAYIESAMTWMSQNIQWLLDGLAVAGGLLPVVGISILLRYLPLKQYFYFAILGFLLVAYINIPITGVALFGIVAAFIIYNQEEQVQIVTNVNSNEELSVSEEDYEYDE